MAELDNGYLEVVQIIDNAHNNAYRSVSKATANDTLAESFMI